MRGRALLSLSLSLSLWLALASAAFVFLTLSGCAEPSPSGKYTCENGTPAPGTPSGGADVARCGSCATNFVLTDTTCSPDGDNDGTPDSTDVDDDGDGLIEINNLDELNAMRFNLAGSSYKAGVDAAENSSGCGGNEGVDACSGYELTRSLDFNHRISSEWRPNNGNPDTSTNAGWTPIGSCNADTNDSGSAVCGDDDDTPFAATFEGNNFTISNLYTRNTTTTDAAIGLFGLTGSSAALRNIGIVDHNIYGGAGVDIVGGLVGQNNGTITHSHATGDVAGGGGADIIGGLVGQNDGSIATSYATGTVSDSGNSNGVIVGGLVGRNVEIITASYAAVTVNGGSGTNSIGGLVGTNTDTITASYATGMVNGNASNDVAGGFIGSLTAGTITASYATGTVNGGAGTDNVGGLIGVRNSGTLTESYGFGTATGETVFTSYTSGGNTISTVHPNTTLNATMLTAGSGPAAGNTNAGAEWADGASEAWDWDFGTSSQNPILEADWDGNGTIDTNEFGAQTR